MYTGWKSSGASLLAVFVPAPKLSNNSFTRAIALPRQRSFFKDFNVGMGMGDLSSAQGVRFIRVRRFFHPPFRSECVHSHSILYPPFAAFLSSFLNNYNSCVYHINSEICRVTPPRLPPRFRDRRALWICGHAGSAVRWPPSLPSHFTLHLFIRPGWHFRLFPPPLSMHPLVLIIIFKIIFSGAYFVRAFKKKFSKNLKF